MYSGTGQGGEVELNPDFHRAAGEPKDAVGDPRRRARGRHPRPAGASTSAAWSGSSTRALGSYGVAKESNLPSVGLPRLTGFEDRLEHRLRPLHGRSAYGGRAGE